MLAGSFQWLIRRSCGHGKRKGWLVRLALAGRGRHIRAIGPFPKAVSLVDGFRMRLERCLLFAFAFRYDAFHLVQTTIGAWGTVFDYVAPHLS